MFRILCHPRFYISSVASIITVSDEPIDFIKSAYYYAHISIHFHYGFTVSTRAARHLTVSGYMGSRVNQTHAAKLSECI